MSCGNSDILALIDYFENGTDLSSRNWDNYNYYDLWNALENGASPPSRPVCGTFSQADVLSVTLGVLGTLTLPSEYLGSNRDFYYLYLKAIGSEDPSPTFTNYCVYQLYQVFTVSSFTGLLDDYPGAAAAYSVRLLSSIYSGPLVRIRKETGGNPEKDFYLDSNNELSLNSSDGGGTTLGSWIGMNNGYIVTWYDQSGNILDLTQASASAQPQILSSGSLITDNGKVAAQLTGNEEFVKAISWNANLYAQFSVMSNSSSGSLISLDNGSIWLRDNGSAMFAQYSGNFFNGTLTTTQQAIYQGYDGSNHLYNRNNGIESLSAGTTAQGTVTELSMFARRTGINRVSGKFQEAIFYLSDQSANISGIQTNQNDFYSIY